MSVLLADKDYCNCSFFLQDEGFSEFNLSSANPAGVASFPARGRREYVRVGLGLASMPSTPRSETLATPTKSFCDRQVLKPWFTISL